MAFFRKPPRWHHHWPMCSHMVGLYHKVPGKAFSKESSQVVQWIAENAGVDIDTADLIRESARQAKVIVYDESTGRWNGSWQSALTMFKGVSEQAKAPAPKTPREEPPSNPAFQVNLREALMAQK